MSVLSPLFSHSALASLSLALSLSQHTHDLAQVTAWLTPIVTPGLMGGGWSLSTWSGLIQATDHDILNTPDTDYQFTMD